MDFPNWGAVCIHGAVFDASGIGASSSRRAYVDFYVAMRPSIFLTLATPLAVPRDSLSWLMQRLDEGEAINPASLRVSVPSDHRIPSVVAHDGRHRMMAVQQALGDILVPVRIDLVTGDDPSPTLIARLRAGMRAQRGPSVVVDAFAETSEDDGLRCVSGVPPPTVMICVLIRRMKTEFTCVLSQVSCLPP
jgi:hypothetical protein